MRVGFSLQYKDTDQAQAVFRLAEFAVGRGHEVAIHHPGRTLRRLHPTWDRFVEIEADRPFLSWVRDLQLLISLEPFSAEHFRGAARHGVKLVVLACWDSVKEGLKECYQMADLVVCPSSQGADLLREGLGLKNCIHIPWDNGLPATRKSDRIDPTRVKVLFPLHGEQSGTTSPDVLNTVWRLLHRCPYVDVTLLYNPKGLTAVTRQAIRRVARTFGPGGQFASAPGPRRGREEALLLYGRHDVVAWAAEQEGLALLGLDALAMGTPVVAYDVAPQNEYLRDRKNAVLVPCELKYNWLGVPWAQPNGEEFEEHLVGLVSAPDALSHLRRFSRYGMAARRERFLAGWRDVLSLR